MEITIQINGQARGHQECHSGTAFKGGQPMSNDNTVLTDTTTAREKEQPALVKKSARLPIGCGCISAPPTPKP